MAANDAVVVERHDFLRLAGPERAAEEVAGSTWTGRVEAEAPPAIAQHALTHPAINQSNCKISPPLESAPKSPIGLQEMVMLRLGLRVRLRVRVSMHAFVGGLGGLSQPGR